MRIGGLQKFSLIDYPGKISAIIFTQGCLFRCHYCHNAELVDPLLFTDPIPVSEVLSFLEERKGKLDGVVITGGEPTIQHDLLEFMETIKKLGFLIKLDTSGVRPDVVKEAVKQNLVDYFAMDIKAPLAKYPKVVGKEVDTEKIWESILFIMDSGIDYEFRTTIVAGLLERDDILEIGNLIKGAKRYALQQFIPDRTLHADYRQKMGFSTAELEGLRHEVGELVGECLVR
ncbi:MAG: anaerobic ribonucleoside-triphosphate reductase activating protein [bacterium]